MGPDFHADFPRRETHLWPKRVTRVRKQRETFTRVFHLRGNFRRPTYTVFLPTTHSYFTYPPARLQPFAFPENCRDRTSLNPLSGGHVFGSHALYFPSYTCLGLEYSQSGVIVFSTVKTAYPFTGIRVVIGFI